MKIIINTVLFLLVPIFGHSQWTHTETVILNWHEATHVTGTNGVTAAGESFEGALEQAGLPPTYHFRINVPSDGKLSAKLSNMVIEDMKLEESTYKNTKWSVKSTLSTAGRSHYANVSIAPIRKSGGRYEKLTSFDLILNLDISQKKGLRDPVFKSRSTLAEGAFYKMSISTSGVYKVTGQQIADAYDIDISNINPAKLKVYVGNSGMLPELVSADRVDDLVETPVRVTGATDGSFDANDEIQFYAGGPDEWILEEENQTYAHSKNNFALTNFVFLNTDGDDGLRLASRASPTSSEYISDHYDHLQVYNNDRINLLGAYQQTEGTGQTWYGEYFGATTNQTFTQHFDFTGHISSQPVTVSYEMAARSSTQTSSTLNIGSNEIVQSFASTFLTNIESAYAKKSKITKEISFASAPEITLEYNKSINKDEAWLNYIQIVSRRAIGTYGIQTFLQDHLSTAYTTARMQGLDSDTEIWNVTDPETVSLVSTNNGGWNYNTESKLQTFVAVQNYLIPELVGNVENQNLHAITDVDLVIVHPTEFKAEADKLANHRSTYDGLVVETVNVNDIYNEFSSGKLDPSSIRDFSRMLHDRSENFKYLLLLGDGSYDYRGLTVGLADHNFVPAYETKESLDPILGYPTDDFYGLLSNEEGASLLGDLDISVGRIPVETTAQAGDIIDKIIKYDIGENRFGDWRLKLGFAADDEDSNTHINQSDDIAEFVRNTYPVYNQQKVFFDAFEQVSTPGGDRYYDASNAINNNLQSGQLMLNYLGHGGPKGWAQERVLKISDIDTWTNTDHYPVLVTATCTFTGYDDPNVVSAGEYAIRKKNGGCVALFTTVRAVYANQNKVLADVIFENIFEVENQQSLRLGDILSKAKNSITSSGTISNSRKFSLIGDPSMKIAVPTQKVVTTEINGKAVNNAVIDTIGALDEVTITGIITDTEGNQLSDFNGTIYPTIYDKQSVIVTLANDGSSSKKEFDVFKNILFKGAASVTNGEFTFSFIVPKDINYKYGFGRISYYADNDQDLDAAGYYEGLVIGGSSENIVNDNEGPEIKLYLNDRQFIDGGSVNKNSLLIVDLEDDLGINVSGNSIGHDLTATLDDGEIFVLNDFYESDVNTFKSGTATFPLNDLTIGPHTITVKAWDTSNNSNEATITFEVVKQGQEMINTTGAYPNPWNGTGNFNIDFTHDMSGLNTTLEVDFYNSIGQLVEKISSSFLPQSNRSTITITGSGNKIENFPTGVYYYKINMTSPELNITRESNFLKLVKVD